PPSPATRPRRCCPLPSPPRAAACARPSGNSARPGNGGRPRLRPPPPAPPLQRPRPGSALPWGRAPARFMGPVPAPFSVRGPVHPAVSPLPPSATRVSSPTPAPDPESVDVDGYVLTPDGVDTAATELRS